MIRTIQILPIPARRIQNIRPNPPRARPRREPFKVELRIRARRRVVPAKVGPRVAPEAALHLVLWLPPHGVADEHAEAGFEGCDHALFGRDVVYCYAAVGLRGELVVEEEAIWDLRDALEGAVLGFEVDVCGPTRS